MIQEFPFGAWLPDQPDFKNPGLTECCNVYPTAAAYEPVLGPVGTGATVAGKVIGASRVIRPDGSLLVIVGTTTDLFTVSGGVVTASGLSLSISDPGAFWTFVPFGQMIWAFCKGVDPHYLPDFAVDAEFEPHPGDAPKAATAAQIGDFILAGNLIDVDGYDAPYRVRWSRFNDPAGDWTDDPATQSGAIDLPMQSGPVVAVATGGIVLQRYGVQRFDYTASTTVFRRTEISSGRGCVAPASVVRVAGVTYFLSDDGFYRTDGANLSAIASEQVMSWFLEEVDGSAIALTQGSINWPARCIVWSFVPADGSHRKQLVYNWEAQRWACAHLMVDWLFDSVRDGLTLEQVSALYPNLDTMPLSLDSLEFQPQGRAFSAIAGGEICNMTGPSLEARFATGEFQPEPGYRCYVNGVAVLVESNEPSALVSLGSRDTFKGNGVRWTAQATLGRDGFAHPVIDGKYVRARVVIPAGSVWAKAQGIQAEYVRTGRA